MKILTLNTHSLVEPNYEEKLDCFIRFILQEKPDVIALQEVNQSMAAASAGDCASLSLPDGIHVPLREDNHALRVVRALQKAGIACSWSWLPIKIGYGKYDEGLAIISLCAAIAKTDAFTISKSSDYTNWRTRMALGVQLQGHPEWFYTSHMGWWQDAEEPFQSQWEKLNAVLTEKRTEALVWLLGDFNSPSEVRGQGYDLISSSGWQDTYLLADEKDDGLTVRGVIDGWRSFLEDADRMNGMRIDHIWCSRAFPIASSRVVFSGKYEPVVSDHFGILIETKGDSSE